MNETVKSTEQQESRRIFLIAGITLSLTVLMLLIQVLVASGDQTAPGLSADKSVDRNVMVPTITNTLQYTIVITNNGTLSADNVVMTDVLTAGLNYYGNLQATAVNGTGSAGVNGSTITWTGSLAGGGYATIAFQASVTDTLPVGTFLTNTAVITGTGNQVLATAVTEIISPTHQFLPLVEKPLPKVTIQATRPNSANAWTVSWSDGGPHATSYEIEESTDPAFGSTTPGSPGDVGLTTSHLISHTLSEQSIYYYRVRLMDGSRPGPWSNVIQVISGYRADFDTTTTNWAVRRMSYLERTFAWIGTGADAGNLIGMVDDKWDWFVASPMIPAPEVPYAIEIRTKAHHQANLVTGGIVLGGDWNGGACPHLGNVYQTTNCFNHFYNFNLIWYGPIKLLHEQVNSLAWCPSCGGSPLKRLGPTDVVAPIINLGPANDYHTYRVEVRQDGVSFFVDGNFVKKYTDTTWINEPYFGIFGSTDEYKPSIWFYDYYQVTPLD